MKSIFKDFIEAFLDSWRLFFMPVTAIASAMAKEITSSENDDVDSRVASTRGVVNAAYGLSQAEIAAIFAAREDVTTGVVNQTATEGAGYRLWTSASLSYGVLSDSAKQVSGLAAMAASVIAAPPLKQVVGGDTTYVKGGRWVSKGSDGLLYTSVINTTDGKVRKKIMKYASKKKPLK